MPPLVKRPDTFSKVEVITGVARRRRFSAELKLPAPKLTVCCRLGEPTFAPTHGNGRVAPKATFRLPPCMVSRFDAKSSSFPGSSIALYQLLLAAPAISLAEAIHSRDPAIATRWGAAGGLPRSERPSCHAELLFIDLRDSLACYIVN